MDDPIIIALYFSFFFLRFKENGGAVRFAVQCGLIICHQFVVDRDQDRDVVFQ